MAVLGPLLWGTMKLTVKYLVIPVAMTVATSMVADALAQKMRQRTAGLESHGVQTHLDFDPALQPAP